MIKIILFISLWFMHVSAMEEPKESIRGKICPAVTIFNDGKNFYVKENNENLKRVHPFNVDILIRDNDYNQLMYFEKYVGYIVASKLSNGEYKLDAYIKDESASCITD